MNMLKALAPLRMCVFVGVCAKFTCGCASSKYGSKAKCCNLTSSSSKRSTNSANSKRRNINMGRNSSREILYNKHRIVELGVAYAVK